MKPDTQVLTPMFERACCRVGWHRHAAPVSGRRSSTWSPGVMECPICRVLWSGQSKLSQFVFGATMLVASLPVIVYGLIGFLAWVKAGMPTV